jgi:hypothetical protein
MLKDDDSILMRCKTDEVFEHYAAQSEYYSGQTLHSGLKWKMRSIG